VLLWLLSPAAADAAPAARRSTKHRVVCDAQTVTITKVRRQIKALGGPLKRFMNRRTAGLTDTTARLRRGVRPQIADEDAPIQDETPAAHIHGTEQPHPGLQPAGLLNSSRDRRPRSRAFSPRSPRGPPSLRLTLFPSRREDDQRGDPCELCSRT
jgi:hypothetical protein